MRSCSAAEIDAGKFFSGSASGRIFRLLIGELFHLIERLLEQVLRRHAMIVHADRHIGRDLIEGVGNRVQARDPVVVVLDGAES